MGALLAQQDDTVKEKAINYIELNYKAIEKTCLVVVFASYKLRDYMLSHLVKLITKIDPLKYLNSIVTLIGRLTKWVMILLW